MHVPDGFLNAPTSMATGVVAVAALAFALNKSRHELGQSGPVRAGLTGCFIFAAQMVNFPVAAGTSGHLIGAALATALVGPWTAMLTMASVLIVQALFFADGGLTALGTNIILLAIMPVLTSAAVFRLMGRQLRRSPKAVAPVAGLAAFLSVLMAALTFTLLYALGGVVEVPTGLLATAMVGTHLLIGVGEAAITSLMITAVLAVRPDLVSINASDDGGRLQLVQPDGSMTWIDADRPAPAVQPAAPVGRRGTATALAIAALVAGGLSLLASSQPDGLESVAGRLGFDVAALDSAVAAGPLADYGIAGFGAFGTTVAGIVGVALTLAICLGVFRLTRLGAAERLVRADQQQTLA